METYTTNEPLELDLSTQEITDALAQAPVYAKTAMVKARTAAAGEVVVTTLADGSQETTNTANDGDIIVTNPGGEEYILKPDSFAKRYEVTEEDGVFRAKGLARAIANPTGGDIKIMAPWGEEQFGDAQCMVATIYDPAQPEVIGDGRYLIGGEEFVATYALTQAATGQAELSRPQIPTSLVIF